MSLTTIRKILIMLSFPLLLASGAMAASTAYARLMLQLPEFWPGGLGQSALKKVDDVKVPVTLGVMSRCPDALICEAAFDKTLSQVGDKIDLSLSFIGRLVTYPISLAY